jgi:phage terminase large subunit-like protein
MKFVITIDNIFIKTDPTGNIKLDKEKSKGKIDGGVCDDRGK